MANEEGSPCMMSACICCHCGCDFGDIAILCHESADCLCFRGSSCIAMGVKPRGVGCVGDKDKGECCKLGCFCCDIGLIMPKVLCARYSKCLCLHSVASLPYSKAYMDECACAVYCISCAPECGCCSTPPNCPAIAMNKQGVCVDPTVAETMEDRKE